MSRRAVIRNVLLGAVVTGLGPLSGAGADPAAAVDSPEVLCRTTFGESGPVGGPVSGEGPSGDPMKTTIGWDPYDWPDGIREIVTCVSVGGRAAPAFTTSIPAPHNDGSQVVALTLPPGAPGTLVCEQSILVGPGYTAVPPRTTSPVCFKLRPNEAPPRPAVPAAGVQSPAPVAPPAPPVPAAPAAPQPKLSAKAPASSPAFIPPPRAAAKAAPSRTGVTPNRRRVPDPVAAVTLPAPGWPELALPAAPGARTRQSVAAVAPAPATAPMSADQAAAPVTTLARTGIDEHIPLASAGGFLALGGAAIILGAPAGRRRARRAI